jgi:hypothetical protein
VRGGRLGSRRLSSLLLIHVTLGPDAVIVTASPPSAAPTCIEVVKTSTTPTTARLMRR